MNKDKAFAFWLETVKHSLDFPDINSSFKEYSDFHNESYRQYVKFCEKNNFDKYSFNEFCAAI